MDNFSERAKEWDANPMHLERSTAIAKALMAAIPDTASMRLLDFGAGTGILGGLLAPGFQEVVMMDNAIGMVEVMQQKVLENGWNNTVPVCHDLMATDYSDKPFDVIVMQLVLHHIEEVSALFQRFNKLLRVGGYLAIADLYPEDGSFHGEGFNGHLGFEKTWLEQTLDVAGFTPVSLEPCFVIRRIQEGKEQEFPVFLSVSQKK
jgi:tRNA (cmo5U34)-methyltransferase